MDFFEADWKLINIFHNDTIATILTHILYRLACNPEHIFKLREEAVRYIGPSEEIVDQKFQHASHMNAVIYETLRLHPFVPTCTAASDTTSRSSNW